MMNAFGHQGKLKVSEEKDRDGEVEVRLGYGGDPEETWLNRDQAIELITHLQNVFGI